jgi:hypothetical protein
MQTHPCFFLTFSDVRSRQNSGLADCADRALRLACEPQSMQVSGINLIVRIALLEIALHRALRSAAAAADAGITDYTCHFYLPPKGSDITVSVVFTFSQWPRPPMEAEPL